MIFSFKRCILNSVRVPYFINNAFSPSSIAFLESLCWQLTDIENLTPPEMLQTYERGWRYLNTLAQPSDEEWRLIQALSAEYGSWLQTNFEALPMMKYQWHDSILVLLQSLRSDALDHGASTLGVVLS